MSDLYPATILSTRPAAEAQVIVELEVPREVWAAHLQPAQYVDLVLPDMPPWRATIANRPGREIFEFLAKDAGERSHKISSLVPDDEIQITLPRGEGFPVNAFRKMDIIMAAGGVAVCAMRAVIEEILLARLEWHKITLFYGERTADRFAFVEERERWREAGIDVHLSASRPSGGTHWLGHTGYIQDLILQMEPETRDAVAFIAGKDGMIEGVRSALGRLGMPDNRMVLNT